ncbi:DUF4124 domain-containing protein [Methylococcus sp. EFPC2]|uniref:DUF4124 domain-containing protein n=1 Tax=Methylococcus sp. EFPC2 TaxID=2812648 RepID=UPI001967456C|nr:DUF4124 domain-containing protein [Methylococcus sp. EFPC2]QSA98306.1 DUF4124 domain-containing protein [Methylococcus sp. EFPC2]
MRRLIMLSLMSPLLVQAASLYEWTDESGQVRFGSRPPVGVQAKPAGERLERLRERGYPELSCKELQDEHVRRVDEELARLKKLPAGFGPDYEFTPEAKQKLVNELLVHRSALVTGRLPEDFTTENGRELSEMKSKYEHELQRLRENLQQQATQLQQKQIQLDRVRREAEMVIQQYRGFYPGMPIYPR